MVLLIDQQDPAMRLVETIPIRLEQSQNTAILLIKTLTPLPHSLTPLLPYDTIYTVPWDRGLKICLLVAKMTKTKLLGIARQNKSL